MNEINEMPFRALETLEKHASCTYLELPVTILVEQPDFLSWFTLFYTNKNVSMTVQYQKLAQNVKSDW